MAPDVNTELIGDRPSRAFNQNGPGLFRGGTKSACARRPEVTSGRIKERAQIGDAVFHIRRMH